MDMKNRRPLTIANGFQHLLAMRHTIKMTNVVEREQLLGEEQFGFRRNRSTLDALFVLNTVIQKSRLSGKKLSICYLDIKKAYDRVWRQGLYRKMEALGLGGKTLQIIKSMYHNDSLRFVVNGKLTERLWLTCGVKQAYTHKVFLGLQS